MANAVYSVCSGKELSEMILDRGPDHALVHLHELYDMHMYHKIVGFLLKCRCFDPRSHGEDIRQCTWASVNIDFKNYFIGKKGENYENPYNFVTTIWRRFSIKHIDEEKRNPTVDIDEAGLARLSSDNCSVDGRILPVHFADPQSKIETLEKIEFAERGFNELSEDDKAILIRVYRDDVGYSQISRELGINETAARKRYSRAIRALKQKCQGAGGV